LTILDFGSRWLHAPAAFPPEKELPARIREEAGWASESVWTQWREKKILFLLPRIEPNNLDVRNRMEKKKEISDAGTGLEAWA
jgi:hypothetical protein